MDAAASGNEPAVELFDDEALNRIIAAPDKPHRSDREMLRRDLTKCLRAYVLLDEFGRVGPAKKGIERLRKLRSHTDRLVKLLREDDADHEHVRELWSAHGSGFPPLLPQMELLAELLGRVSLERAKIDGSPLENLIGVLLRAVFARHFGKPGVSRSLGGAGEPNGPYIRFAEQVCVEVGIQCSRETIVSSMKRLGANFRRK